MRIAILSDTHSRYPTIETALQLVEERHVDLILHCGDIEDSEAVWLFPPNTHFVFGNCDHERSSIRMAVHGIGATLYEPMGKLELNGVRIAWLHGDDHKLMESVEKSGEFDYLFYGHTHIADERRTGPTRVINPGALHRARQKQFLVLDVDSGETETVIVE
ncbi:MAG TPA: YfcE family phosphodiesterase [Gemmataceae bacterium]|nr:YfcE family phosphodiesterase [Gemmataceae bacterium]